MASRKSPNQQNDDGFEIQQTFEIAKKIGIASATTVIPFTKTEVGYRRLTIFWSTGPNLALFFFAPLINPANNPGALMAFAVTSSAIGFGQRIVAWRKYRRGVVIHSQSPGRSRLSWLPWPRVMRSNRRVERYIDPLVVIGAGLACSSFSSSLSAWLVWAGCCLSMVEHEMENQRHDREMDARDGLIDAMEFSQMVERFEQPPTGTHQHAQRGLPTGLGNDTRQSVTSQESKKGHSRIWKFLIGRRGVEFWQKRTARNKPDA